MLRELTSYLTSYRASKIPLSFILACLRLGLSIDLIKVSPGLILKLEMLIERSSSSAECLSMVQEKWMMSDLQEHFKRNSSTTQIAASAVKAFMTPQNSKCERLAFTPYRNANCWQKQKAYYAQAGLEAWTTANAPVPSQVSSNLFVAEQYLGVIVAQLAHLAANVRRDKLRVNIVEAASGHGIVSVLLARLLKIKSISQRVLEHIRDEEVKAGTPRACATTPLHISANVIATDFQSETLHNVMNLPWVHNLCTEGLLDFCVLDADELPDAQVCLRSGRHAASLPCDLLVIIGQYAFDSLSSDLYVTTSGSKDALGDRDIWEIGTVQLQQERRNQCRAKKARSSHISAQPESKERLVARRVTVNEGDIHVESARNFLRNRSPACESACVLNVPTAGKALLQRIRASFPVIPVTENASFDDVTSSTTHALQRMMGNVILLAGDFVIDCDDERWQAAALSEALLQAVDANSNSATADDSAPLFQISFTPPDISPRPDITALPISLAGLDLVFTEVFPSHAEAGTGSCLRTTGPLGGSCFTVALLSNGHVAKGIHPLLSFGPCEYQSMREFLRTASSNHFVSHITVSFLKEFMQIGGSTWMERANSDISTGLHIDSDAEGGELSVFLELRWLILRKCAHQEKDLDALLWFVRLAVRAVETNRHFWLSRKEASEAKCQLSQWLLAAATLMQTRGSEHWTSPLFSLLQVFSKEHCYSAQPSDSAMFAFAALEEKVMAALAIRRLSQHREFKQTASAPHSTKMNADNYAEVMQPTLRRKCSRQNRPYVYYGRRRGRQTAKLVSALDEMPAWLRSELESERLKL